MEGEPGRASLLPGARYKGAPGILIGSGAGVEEMAAYDGPKERRWLKRCKPWRMIGHTGSRTLQLLLIQSDNLLQQLTRGGEQ